MGKTQVAADGRVMLNTEGMSEEERAQLQQLLMFITTGERLLSISSYDDAEKYLVMAVELISATMGKDHILGDRAYQLLAQLYSATSKLAAALAMHNRSYEIRAANMGSDHAIVAQSLISMAQILIDLHRYGEAEKLSFRALAIFEEKSAAPGSPEEVQRGVQMASAKFLVGKVYKAQANYEPALEILDQVVDQAVEHVGKGTLFAIHAICTRAAVLRAMGDWDAAIAAYDDLLVFLENAGMELSNPVRSAVANHRASALWDSGDVEMAAEVQAEIDAAAEIPPTTDSVFLRTLNSIYFYTLHSQEDLDKIAKGEELEKASLVQLIQAEDAGNAPVIVERSAHAVLKYQPCAPKCIEAMDAAGSESLYVVVSLDSPAGADNPKIVLETTISRSSLPDPIQVETDKFDVCPRGISSSVVRVYADAEKSQLIGQHHQLVYAPFDLQAVTKAESISYTDISSFVQYQQAAQ